MVALNALTGLSLRKQKPCDITCACLSPGGNFVLSIQYMYTIGLLSLIQKLPFTSLSIGSNLTYISHLCVMDCAAYVFLHEDQRQNKMSPHAELMTFIGFTDGMKGWKFMRSTNAIFHATQAVFDESTFLHCPGSQASIPAIETGVLNIDEENIPSEDIDSQQAPPAVEANPIWLHSGGYPYIPDNIVPGGQLPPGDPPVSPPSPSISYTTSSRQRPLPPSQGSGSKATSQRSGSR